ncbi:SOUL heme-binding family protein [Forsythia ovata]|uniref:SOUL heme-binding family protein n=1 Tax=Forsythia ovata TaxID=205694 RepID=A0ABD1XCX8_9LAMI
MESKKWQRLCLVVAHCIGLLAFSHAIESPQYKIMHSWPDIEVRMYKESSWISAPVRGGDTSFENSTKSGFHRLYQYIHGANLNSTKIMMTAPVLTNINQTENGSDYYVKFYVPEKYEAAPPLPSSALNLQVEKWRTNCIAVRKFSGFAKDENVRTEIEAFLTSLRNLWTGKTTVFEDKYSFTIAQYNASFHLSGRLNEVWMNVSGLEIEGCY